MKKQKDNIEIVATNRKARYFYNVLETFEAGICLEGPEVKSLRLKQANISQSFAKVKNNEIFLYGMHISPYKFNTLKKIDPLRTRKLLFKKSEIKKISQQVLIKGMTLIPLEVYFKNGWAKILLGLCKGRKTPDKHEEIKRKEIDRDMKKKFKEKYR